MNKHIKIGYLTSNFSQMELQHLIDAMQDCTLCLFENEDRLFTSFGTEDISAYAKNINEIPIFQVSNPLVIAALIERNIDYSNSIREELPPNGQGISGIVCHRDDFATRKTLSINHHHETGYCSNIERKILIAFPSAKVHCQIDRANRYNLGVHIPHEEEKQEYYFSQSTFVGLAEKAIKEIKDS